MPHDHQQPAWGVRRCLPLRALRGANSEQACWPLRGRCCSNPSASAEPDSQTKLHTQSRRKQPHRQERLESQEAPKSGTTQTLSKSEVLTGFHCLRLILLMSGEDPCCTESKSPSERHRHQLRNAKNSDLGMRPCSVTQSCLTLCDPMGCSLPCSSVHGILQARILEWVAISSSRGILLTQEGQTCISCIGRWILLPLSHLGNPNDLCMGEYSIKAIQGGVMEVVRCHRIPP